MSGTFGNLYDQWIGAQCHEIRIQAILSEKPSSTLSGSMSMVAKSDFPDTTKTAAATGVSAASGPSDASLASSAAKLFPSSGSPVKGVAPPAKTGNTAPSYKAKGATLSAFVAILGAVLTL